jgi:hypothetical protein
MKLYQDFIISGNPNDLTGLWSYLKTQQNSWKINADLSKPDELNYYSDQMALDVPSHVDSHEATLFLFMSKDQRSCSVGNIVPNDGNLTPEEYNHILLKFNTDCVQPVVEVYNLQVQFSPDEILLEGTLSPENMELLLSFSHLANKNTGSKNPYDYNRWLEFIAASVRDNQIVRSELLRAWLIDQGFPGDVAMDLVLEYQFGLDLVKHLESRTTVQEELRAAR